MPAVAQRQIQRAQVGGMRVRTLRHAPPLKANFFVCPLSITVIDMEQETSEAKGDAGRFAEHVRTAHFAVIATCFVFIVAASLSEAGDADKALVD
jgi:hypothetical protein